MKKTLLFGGISLAAIIIGVLSFLLIRKNTRELVLVAPKEVSVSLFKDFKSTKKAVKKTSTETKGDLTYHIYKNLKPGNYNYLCKGNGYYSLEQNLYYSSEKATKRTEIDVNPGKTSGKGYESCETIFNYTKEVEDTLLAPKESWKNDFKDVYSTPTLASKTKAQNEFTSQEEMESFVERVVSSAPYMYLYTLCKTPSFNFNMPAVFVTSSDLSAAKTVEEASSIINKNGKINIMYEAQIHGNEPAGGDGALAILKTLSGEYGKEIINQVNVIVIPRANPDGSFKFSRKNVKDNIDLNRDHIKVQSEEIKAIHNLYNLTMPYVFIDGHEYTPSVQSTETTSRDILFAVGGGFNSTKDLVNAGTAVTQSIIENLNKENINATYYPATKKAGTVQSGFMINTANFSSGRGYYSLKGAITLLVETRGIDLGKQGFEKRVVGQYLTVKSLLDYVSANKEQIKSAVDAERQHITEVGKKYDENNIFALSSGSNKQEKIVIKTPLYNFTDGSVKDKDKTVDCFYYDKAERVRTRPTAYIIPKDAVNAEKVAEIIKLHNISFYELPNGASQNLKNYTGSVESAAITDEEKVTFNNGAYVFPLNQVGGTLLMYLFEPDVTDTATYKSTLAQSNTLVAQNGKFPIYRSEHDLTADGKIQ